MISADATQCEYCGEIIGRRNSKTPQPGPNEGPTAEDKVAESLLNAMPSPFTMSPGARWWMMACLVCSAVSVAFAFQSYSEMYIIAAFAFAAAIFLPFVLIIFGHLFAMALVARREVTYVALALIALAGLGAIGWGISKSHMAFNFSTLADLFRNENFGRVLITLIICIAAIAALVPLSRGTARYLGSSRDVSGFKAETQRELGLKFNDNETNIKLKTLEMQRELELKKLEIEEQRLQVQAKQVELEVKQRKMIADQTATSTAVARLTNRMQECALCGGLAYFSDLNLSPSLCDDHNEQFVKAFKRCGQCNRALPVSSYPGGTPLCPTCRKATEAKEFA
jgi:hypothetical protein